jgi:hypothetical protein
MTYIFEFEVIPGKANEFWAFMEKTGAPFWTKYKEVKSYKVFTKIGGEPIYEGHVELDNFTDFDKIRTDPEWDSVSAATSQYVFNCRRRFILPVKSFD